MASAIQTKILKPPCAAEPPLSGTQPVSGASPLPMSGLIAAIATISVAGIALGHSLPLFSILLESYGAKDGTIGLNAGTAAIGSVIAAPFYPAILKALGIRRLLLVCLVVMIAAYLGLYAVGDNVALWFPLRFVIGFAATGLFVGSEIWINGLAPDHLRGRIIGVYGTFLALGFSLGPLLIDLVGYEGFAPFAVAIAIFTAATVPVVVAGTPPASPPDAASGFFKLLPRAPATFSAPMLFAGIEAAVLVFLPLLAIERGWGPSIGAITVTIYGLGIVVAQYPIGLLAERLGYARSLWLGAVLSALGAVTFAMINWSLGLTYVTLFIWGGVLAGLYTVGLSLVGDRFGPQTREAANTGFVFAYGMGAMLGPAIAGLVRQAYGARGLDIFLIVALTAYAILTWQRRRAEIP